MAYFFNPTYFEKLKKSVLKVSGLTTVNAANCRTISSLIETAIKQRVSETTIKRIYGFAYSKFTPSLFTLDALARYCAYRNWENFCDQQEADLPSANSTSVSYQAGKVTKYTLQALKNKSGIPFNQTICRAFVDNHMEAFINGDCTATIFAAPAGRVIAGRSMI